MKGQPGRFGEGDISFLVMWELAKQARGLSVSSLHTILAAGIRPAGKDAEIATHRSDIRLTEAVRNIVSHRHGSERNIIKRGWVAYAPGGDGFLALTDLGHRVLLEHVLANTMEGSP